MSTVRSSDLSLLEERFGRLADERAARRHAAHAVVVRWEWFTGPASDMRPLWFERNRSRLGRRRAERPSSDEDALRIGFDGEHRLVVTEEYSGFLGGAMIYETFRVHGPGAVEEAHFDQGAPVYLHDHRLVGDRVDQSFGVARDGCFHEVSEYTDGKVTHVVVRHLTRQERDGSFQVRRRPTVFTAAHDGDGLVWLAGNDETVYERPPASFTIEAACETVRAELVRAVPKALAERQITHAVYALAVAYLPAHPLEFTVWVGLDADRVEYPAPEPGAGVPWIGWWPAEMSGEVEPDMTMVDDVVRVLAQELTLLDSEDLGAKCGSEISREVACAVARELNDVDWTGILSVTDDFVVYAVDFEVCDFERNLAACLPPERFTSLRDSV
jgi:hypothetical protein